MRLIKSSLRLDDPVLFLMDKSLTGIRGEVGGPEDLIPLGRADVVRAGQDMTLVSYGASVRVCHQAADMLGLGDSGDGGPDHQHL